MVRKSRSSADSTRMPLLHVHVTPVSAAEIPSATSDAQLLSEVKMSSASMNSRQPRRVIARASSAQRPGDFLRYPSPSVIFDAQKSHLNTQPRENSVMVAGRLRTMI